MKKILIVEDESPLLHAIQRKLEDSGFEAIPAKDGKDALDHLMSAPSKPDLIWLDYYLPSMNGLELLRRVKRHPELRSIPVIVVSNTAGPEKIDAMMELGVEGYFVKVEKRLNEIIKAVQSIVGQGGRNA